jgi:hypothetical protein
MFEKDFREWVPIRLGQQPQRKATIGEKFRVCNDRRRSTAALRKSGELLGCSAPNGGRETVRKGSGRGGREAVVEPSLRDSSRA